jgi:predicted transcriptional regulator
MERTEKTMKPLSQSLEELAARVKVLEDSATATFEADRAKLEKRRHEIDDAIKGEVDEFESAVREAAAAGRTWWNDTKASMKRPLEEVRARVDKRQSEHELHRALRTAKAAEEDAAAAIEVAAYFLNVAEYAVIDATLARMSADDLAAATPVTDGATS